MSTGAEVFSCRMCGHCCQGVGGIVLQAHDEERLAGHLGLTIDRFRQEYTTLRRGKRQAASPDGQCVFFQPGTGCTLHAARPDICRAWPFFRGNIVDPVSLSLAREYCPGIRADAPFPVFAAAGRRVLADLARHRPPGPVPEALVCLPEEV